MKKKSTSRIALALLAAAALCRPASAKIIGDIMAAPTGVIQKGASRPVAPAAPARAVRVQPVYFQAPAYTPYASQVYYAPAYGYGGYGVPAGTVSIGGGARMASGISFLPAAAAPAAPRPVGPRSNAEVTSYRLQHPALATPAAGARTRQDPMLGRTQAAARDFQQRYGFR